MASLERSKQNDLSRVIFALGIPEVGEKMAALLAQQFGTMEKLSWATLEELTAIDGFGEVVAQNIVSFFWRSATADRSSGWPGRGSTWRAKRSRRGTPLRV